MKENDLNNCLDALREIAFAESLLILSESHLKNARAVRDRAAEKLKKSHIQLQKMVTELDTQIEAEKDTDPPTDPPTE